MYSAHNMAKTTRTSVTWPRAWDISTGTNKASEIQTVVVGGKTLLKDGKLLTVDEAAAIAKAKEYGKKVATSLQ